LSTEEESYKLQRPDTSRRLNLPNIDRETVSFLPKHGAENSGSITMLLKFMDDNHNLISVDLTNNPISSISRSVPNMEKNSIILTG
jgi:hypothetical protein